MLTHPLVPTHTNTHGHMCLKSRQLCNKVEKHPPQYQGSCCPPPPAQRAWIQGPALCAHTARSHPAAAQAARAQGIGAACRHPNGAGVALSCSRHNHMCQPARGQEGGRGGGSTVSTACSVTLVGMALQNCNEVATVTGRGGGGDLKEGKQLLCRGLVQQVSTQMQ